MERGLEILAKVKRELKVPILTDVHNESQVAQVAAVVDVLQTPAFLSRQTDFIRAVAQSGKPVNIKKGQFLAPHDMKNVIDKARAAAREKGLPDDVLHGLRTRRELRLQQPGQRHALPGHHARDERAGGLRRHAQRAAARRPGHQQRRPARVRAGAEPRGGGRGRGRASSWKPTPTPPTR